MQVVCLSANTNSAGSSLTYDGSLTLNRVRRTPPAQSLVWVEPNLDVAARAASLAGSHQL